MPLKIIRGDITKLDVDAIVNAANETLLGGGGVDGCIHRAAGPGLLAECRTLGGCKTGNAKITAAYNLPCRHVIHTVGPVWHGGGYGERDLLVSCYRTSLALAKEAGCQSVAFPLISAGVYGYPKAQAIRVAMDTITEFLAENEMDVYMVIFGKEAFKISEKLFDDITQYIDDNYVDEYEMRYPESRRIRMIQENRSDYMAAFLSKFADEETECCDAAPIAPSDAAPMAPSAPPPEPCASMPAPSMSDKSAAPESIEAALNMLDESFSQMLLRKIDEKGMTDPECYKKANVDRKLFSKIKNDPSYKPSKPTVIAFAIALELPLAEACEMLMKAGFALSHSNKFDVIIEYFIINGNYNIFEINETLFAFDQSLLGA